MHLFSRRISAVMTVSSFLSVMEQAGLTIMGYLLAIDATRAIKENGPDFVKSAKVFVNFASAEVAKHTAFVESLNPEEVKTYAQN